jgi:hypothetical protein
MVSINNAAVNRPDLGFAIEAAEDLLDVDGNIFFDCAYVIYNEKRYFVRAERTFGDRHESAD